MQTFYGDVPSRYPTTMLDVPQVIRYGDVACSLDCWGSENGFARSAYEHCLDKAPPLSTSPHKICTPLGVWASAIGVVYDVSHSEVTVRWLIFGESALAAEKSQNRWSFHSLSSSFQVLNK